MFELFLILGIALAVGTLAIPMRMAADPNAAEDNPGEEGTPDSVEEEEPKLVLPELLGDDPLPKTQPIDHITSWRSNIEAQQQALNETLASLSEKLDGLQQPAAGTASAEAEDYEDDAVSKQISQLQATMAGIKEQMDANQAQSEQQENLMSIQRADQEAASILGELNKNHTMTSKIPNLANKIAEDVRRQVLMHVQANPQGHGMTRQHVIGMWRQEVHRWRDILANLPSVSAQQAEKQASEAKNALPEAGTGMVPSAGDKPALSPTSDEYWEAKRKHARSIIARVSQRQGAV